MIHTPTPLLAMKSKLNKHGFLKRLQLSPCMRNTNFNVQEYLYPLGSFNKCAKKHQERLSAVLITLFEEPGKCGGMLLLKQLILL